MPGWVPNRPPATAQPLRIARVTSRPRRGSGRERTARLFVGRHRRPLSLLLVLLAVWLTIRSAAPDRPSLAGVLVAARDLPAGQMMTTGDLRTARLPADALPTGRVVSLPAHSVLASPLRAGEPLTDARLLGPGLLTGARPGAVAVPVRLSDPSAAALARVGDRVDVLAGPPAAASGEVSAQHLVLGARVLAVTSGTPAGEAGGLTGGLTGDLTSGATAPDGQAGVLVLAVTSAEAERLTAAQPQSYLSVAILPDP